MNAIPVEHRSSHRRLGRYRCAQSTPSSGEPSRPPKVGATAISEGFERPNLKRDITRSADASNPASEDFKPGFEIDTRVSPPVDIDAFCMAAPAMGDDVTGVERVAERHRVRLSTGDDPSLDDGQPAPIRHDDLLFVLLMFCPDARLGQGVESDWLWIAEGEGRARLPAHVQLMFPAQRENRMFDAPAHDETTSLQKPMNLAEVYGWFAGGEGKRPAWLNGIVKAEPSEDDLHAIAEEWARREPGYLDQLMLLPWEGAPEGSSVDVAAEIATVARYRVDSGFTGEPWSASQGRLGMELSD